MVGQFLKCLWQFLNRVADRIATRLGLTPVKLQDTVLQFIYITCVAWWVFLDCTSTRLGPK